jgi:hypothetical protein
VRKSEREKEEGWKGSSLLCTGGVQAWVEES